MYYTTFDTPLCKISLVGNKEGLSQLHIYSDEIKKEFRIADEWIKNDDFFKKEKKQIIEFLEGKRNKFDIKLNLQGTEFQKKVWQALLKIPYGKTASYQDIATSIGNKKACRAVGMANSKNHIPLIIPCHRVIGKNGKLTGFALGLKLKKQLLELESKN